MTAAKTENEETRIDTNDLIGEFLTIRQFSEHIAEPLSAEDCMVQSMDDVSPTRWHLAHTTWFFETFALREEPGYRIFNEQFNYLFNSYYNTIGEQFSRSRRGVISRPGLQEIKRYRQYVNKQIAERLQSNEYAQRMHSILRVGLQHEQQHQELMLTDIKHVLSCNPMLPVYRNDNFDDVRSQPRCDIHVQAGNYDIGHTGDAFCFDNESPTHQVYLSEYSIANRLVTCGEYMQFIDSQGYQRPEHWLSLGWQTVQDENWTEPLYWTKQDGQWMQFTLAGLIPINPDWPVCHVSLFEADAYARWVGKRLPTEFEWEVAASRNDPQDLSSEPFADYLFDHQLSIHPTRSPKTLMGGLWQWTSSSYQAFPGYQPPAGAIGEYNGKFMCNQYVLRGGSVATHSSHIRPTYRNFFPAHARWQFTGIRLAE